MSQDILFQLGQPLLDRPFNPTFHGVCDDAHHPVFLRSLDDVDDCTLDLQDICLLPFVRQLVLEPLRDLVEPVVKLGVPARHPFGRVRHVVLELLANPRCWTECVVPIKEDHRPTVGESARERPEFAFSKNGWTLARGPHTRNVHAWPNTSSVPECLSPRHGSAGSFFGLAVIPPRVSVLCHELLVSPARVFATALVLAVPGDLLVARGTRWTRHVATSLGLSSGTSLLGTLPTGSANHTGPTRHARGRGWSGLRGGCGLGRSTLRTTREQTTQLHRWRCILHYRRSWVPTGSLAAPRIVASRF
mmetsp:Transcript_12490/g.34448  ORF Transcript_12490/g.34448 Transcript_12490/m.34448 type:complete len:304 (+) Transcript_12490:785-1696(+)